jgi:hypothetical protein
MNECPFAKQQVVEFEDNLSYFDELAKLAHEAYLEHHKLSVKNPVSSDINIEINNGGGDCEAKLPLREPNEDLLKRVNVFDENRKVRYIPTRPPYLQAPPNGPFPPQYGNSFYPWFSNTIPYKPLTNPVPPTLPNGDGYDKVKAINYYLYYYAGYDGFDPNFSITYNQRNTLFQMNLVDRGPDNYNKKIYMNATRGCIMDRYAEKIDRYLNRAFLRMTTGAEPVLSCFSSEIMKLFFDVHIGTSDCPQYVYNYFEQFLKLISYQEKQYYDATEGDGAWDNALRFGWKYCDAVFQYLDEQAQILIQNEDESTFGYWWFVAGMAKEAISAECLHNILAFNNFTAMLMNAIKDKLSGVPYPPAPYGPGPIQYHFFQKFKEAITGVDRMNVSREFMRLTSPSASSTSTLVPAPNSHQDPTTQVRHLNQLIMITNEAYASGNSATYFAYNPNRYGSNNNASFDNNVCPVIVTNPADVNDPAKNFDKSPVDNETVIDRSAPTMNPVYNTAWYMPFGLGYRRCAGESFVHLVLHKILTKFGDLNYEFRQPASNYPIIGIAFITRVPDNLFVIKPT